MVMVIYKLTFGTSLTFLLGLLSAILIPVALQLSHCSILLAFIFILLFCRAVAIAVSPLLLLLLGLPCRSSLLSTIFNSSRHLYCHANFIAAVHFVAVQPASLQLFIQARPFFCWVVIFALVLLSPYSFCC